MRVASVVPTRPRTVWVVPPEEPGPGGVPLAPWLQRLCPEGVVVPDDHEAWRLLRERPYDLVVLGAFSSMRASWLRALSREGRTLSPKVFLRVRPGERVPRNLVSLVDARVPWQGEWRAFAEDVFAAYSLCEEGPPGEGEEGHRVRSGGVILDCRTQRVWSRGRWNALTPLEFRLLHLLMCHPGVPYPPKELVSRVWGYGEEGRSDPPIRWHIKNLRDKIEPDPFNPRLLRTLSRRGYLFDPGPSGADVLPFPGEKASPVREESGRGGLPAGWAEFLGSLTEGFPGALGVTLQGKVLWWNAQAERLLGIPRGEVLGRELLPFLREDRRIAWQAGRSWPRGADGEEDWRFVLEVRRPLEETARVEGVFAGRIFGGVFFGTWSFAPLAVEGEADRLRKAWRQSRGLLRAAFLAREMTGWVLDPRRETLLWEDGLPRFLGVDLSGALEVSLACFLDRWVVPKDQALLRRFLLDPPEKVPSLKIRMKTESGRDRPVVFYAQRLPGAEPEEEDARVCGVCAEERGDGTLMGSDTGGGFGGV